MLNTVLLTSLLYKAILVSHLNTVNGCSRPAVSAVTLSVYLISQHSRPVIFKLAIKKTRLVI